MNRGAAAMDNNMSECYLCTFNTLHTSTNVIYITGLCNQLMLSTSGEHFLMQLQQDKEEEQSIGPLQVVTAFTELYVDNSFSRLNQQDSLSDWVNVILCSMTCAVESGSRYSVGGDCLDVILLCFSACLPGLEHLNLSQHSKKSMSHKETEKKTKNSTNSCHKLLLPGRQGSVVWQCRGIWQIHVVIFFLG